MVESRVADFCIKAKAYRGDQLRVRWSKEIISEALELIKHGANIEWLAQRANISRATIDHWIESRSNKLKNKPKFSEVKIKPLPVTQAESGIEIILVTSKQRIEVKGLSIDGLKVLLREGLL